MDGLRRSPLQRITIHHRTVYRYAVPVNFGQHQLMLRPRESQDLRLRDLTLVIHPDATLHWIRDVFGNAVAIATFSDASKELVIDSSAVVDQVSHPDPAAPLQPHARSYPFNYSADEQMDLGRMRSRHGADPWGNVDVWARWFVESDRPRGTIEILTAITRSIAAQFAYAQRDEMGTQDPVETLAAGSGNCRDFALFMMEAVRSLGFAARFVSGYVYSGPVQLGRPGLRGGEATHAWVEVYLPGVGWLEFDPTNGLVGGKDLICVAAVREPGQALPVSGTYDGRPTDFLSMSVDVSVEV